MVWLLSAVVIDNRHVVGIAVPPGETNRPLVVDADAVLPGAIATQFLQAVAGRDAKIVGRLRRVDRDELAEHRPSQLGWIPADRLAGKEAFGVTIAEALDHRADVNAMR